MRETLEGQGMQNGIQLGKRLKKTITRFVSPKIQEAQPKKKLQWLPLLDML